MLFGNLFHIFMLFIVRLFDDLHAKEFKIQCSSQSCQVRLRSRRSFIPAARNLLNNLAELGIRASQWTNNIQASYFYTQD